MEIQEEIVKVGVLNKSSNDLPVYAKEGDSGMDVRASLGSPVVVGPFERVLIPTGLYVELPMGYEIQVRPRSGNALKKGLTVLNTPGTIDSGYRNEIGVIIFNTGKESQVIEPGERIAQFVLQKVPKIVWEPKETIDTNTDRGEGGYGHTGNK
jgi:dUTP pyrophosphatase